MNLMREVYLNINANLNNSFSDEMRAITLKYCAKTSTFVPEKIKGKMTQADLCLLFVSKHWHSQHFFAIANCHETTDDHSKG
ncbi:CLUMA_CG004895, isoform A [Clunio marinus]|uniref:CLUMA_CG004895, isoform A n=1 Tax=Clunio marinus TaxID=568069 RepID=A0A1J1HV30_9DIPT|nr:CLUMA_CG004895, isoform A [Clunio marinus]